MSGGITKVNPTLANVSRNFNGRTIMGFTIDLAVNGTNFASTEMGPTGAVQAVLDVLRRNVTVIAMSALRTDGSNAGQVFDIMVEGEYGTDTYDGQNSETLAAHLEDELQALTSVGVGTVSLASATVTASTGFPYYA
jgi:hypothetical protein